MSEAAMWVIGGLAGFLEVIVLTVSGWALSKTHDHAKDIAELKQKDRDNLWLGEAVDGIREAINAAKTELNNQIRDGKLELNEDIVRMDERLGSVVKTCNRIERDLGDLRDRHMALAIAVGHKGTPRPQAQDQGSEGDQHH